MFRTAALTLSLRRSVTYISLYSSCFSQPSHYQPQPELGFQAPPNPTRPLLLPSPSADALARLLIHHPPSSPLHLHLPTLNLTSSLVLQTLLRLRNTTNLALNFFFWARDNAGHRHSPEAYELMLDSLGRGRQFDVAWRLIGEMERCGGGPPTPGMFGVLIKRYVAAGLTREAVRVFDDMRGFVGREADGGYFEMLIDSLCKYGYPKVATEIFNKRKSIFVPSEKVYNILIYGWCKINKPEMARKFLTEMMDRGLVPTVITYNLLLSGICRRASLHPDTRFDRTIRTAEDVLEEMRSREIEPDATSYSIVLHVYGRANKPELSVCMLRTMKEKGICPTVSTYTSVIKCLASCGRLEDAEKLINEMENDGVCPSPTTFNCFFREYRGKKDADSALRMYKKLKEKGSFCEPDIRTYNILIEMFSQLNRMGIVRELWKDLIESRVDPDLDSYTFLIHGLCGRQKWREASQFSMEMIEKGFLPQKVTFEMLYRGLIQADMLTTWRQLKNKVEEQSLKFGTEFQHYHLNPYKR